MSVLDDLIDRMMNSLGKEFEGDHNRVSREELDRGKEAPGEEAPVGMTLRQHYSFPSTRVPHVEAYARGRQARRDAEAERRALAHMVWKARRTALGIDSIAAVNAHVFMQGDRLVGALDDEYHGRLRRTSHNKLMAELAAWCISSGLAGMKAVAETYPKRLSDDL